MGDGEARRRDRLNRVTPWAGLPAQVTEREGGGRNTEMLTTIEKVNVLQKAPVFAGVRTESLARVAAIAREVSCDARQPLFRENDAADTMFLILEGRVALARDGKEPQEVGAGELLGAMPLLAGESHAQSAVATQSVRALQIEQQDLYDAMAEDFNITRGVLRALVHGAPNPAK